MTETVLRLTFGVSASVHFLFVLVTLGVTPLLTGLGLARARRLRSGVDAGGVDELLNLFGRAYLINYALGIVSGIVMEFQIALNWPGLGERAGAVFGAPLALETVVAFMIESTFVGLWVLGWDRVPARMHACFMGVVTVSAYLSAYFVMVANGFMHRPDGAEFGTDGHATLTSAAAVFLNPSGLTAFVHIVGAAAWTAGFLVASTGARRLLVDVADRAGRRLVAGGIVAVLVSAPVLIAAGSAQFDVARPGGISEDSSVGALLSLMVGIGSVGTVVALFVLAPLLVRGRLFRMRRLLHLIRVGLPAPAAAAVLGWVFRETERQPWAIDGVLTTEDAISHQVTAAPIGLVCTVIVVALGVVNVRLQWRALGARLRAGPPYLVEHDGGDRSDEATTPTVLAFGPDTAIGGMR